MEVALPDLYEASIDSIQVGLAARRFTSEQLCTAYFRRIDEHNIKGFGLRASVPQTQEQRSMIIQQARELDGERAKGYVRGPLHGICILVKDMIDCIGFPSGSFALQGTLVSKDAECIARLRAQGVIILGKSTLSQWGYMRDNDNLPSGWSATTGQARSPFHPRGDPDGSSTGSAIATCVGLATACIGLEANGSTGNPASKNNVVGLKPTPPLVPRTNGLATSGHTDSVGPMTRSIRDAALLLQAMAGPSDKDTFSLGQPKEVPNYLNGLSLDALKGVRLGIDREAVNKRFGELENLDDICASPDLETGLKAELPGYLAQLQRIPSGVKSLADIIHFNEAHPELEMPKDHEAQGGLKRAEETTGYDINYIGTMFALQETARRSIDNALAKHQLSALVFPIVGDSGLHALAANAGLPTVMCPAGFADKAPEIADWRDKTGTLLLHFPGQPVGLMFMGPAWSEAQLLSFAYAFEQISRFRLSRKALPEAIPKTQLEDVL